MDLAEAYRPPAMPTFSRNPGLRRNCTASFEYEFEQYPLYMVWYIHQIHRARGKQRVRRILEVCRPSPSHVSLVEEMLWNEADTERCVVGERRILGARLCLAQVALLANNKP